jgi:hypothetical protein
LLRLIDYPRNSYYNFALGIVLPVHEYTKTQRQN